MNRCFTTMGYYEEISIDPAYISTPSISREEQIRRLEAFKSQKYKKDAPLKHKRHKKIINYD